MWRDLDVLRREQADVLEERRAMVGGGSEAVHYPRPGGATAAVAYGRVMEVIASDPCYGPHLRVVRQVWSGMPPTCSDAAAPVQRCYPSPNHAVSDYVVSEIVRLAATHGAMLAEKLG